MIEDIEELLNIGIALSTEKNHNRLLEKILTEARRITNADAGTLFLREEDQLVFKIIQNDTLNIHQGGTGEIIDLPPVAMNQGSVSAVAALTHTSIRITDVYDTKEYDFTGPRKYDMLTGYRTQSMLVIPLENHEEEVIGVLQLINAKDDTGKTIAFPPYYEKVISSLASQAAISLTNMQFIQEINHLFHSFVEIMATVIDAQTPYNANHSKNIALLAEAMANYINQVDTGKWAKESFDEDEIAQLTMAAWLHDIGKITVPLKIMDKPSRLGQQFPLLMQRLDLIEAQLKIIYLEKKINNNLETDKVLELWWEKNMEILQEAKEKVTLANNPSAFVSEELCVALEKLANYSFEGIGCKILTEEELTCLKVPKGTLTEEERKIIEGHVTMAQRILEKITFTKKLKNVPKWVVLHHEFLDGTGYPYGVREDNIPLEARILTVLDIYDALTARDRPYKKAMPPEKALSILKTMGEEGKLDIDLVKLFIDSKIWRLTTEKAT